MQSKNEHDSQSTGMALTSDRELQFTRLLNAPRELVFKVWTDPKHVVQWWGPTGFTTTNHGMDLRPDGVWRFTMHGPDGKDYPNKIVFLEIVKPERLVYRHADDEDTESISFYVTILFEEQGDKTQLHMKMVFETKEELERVAREYGAIEGAHQHIARLEAYVSTILHAPNEMGHIPFMITRTFDAPRKVVFQAFSEAERLACWWGPKGMSIEVRKLDFRPGGIFHYKMVGANGYTMWGRFTYREILAPKKIIFVNSFSDEQGNIARPPFPDPWPWEIVNIIMLEEQDGKTTLTLHASPIHASEEEHKTFEQGFESMDQGYGGTFDQLHDYLSSL